MASLWTRIEGGGIGVYVIFRGLNGISMCPSCAEDEKEEEV